MKKGKNRIKILISYHKESEVIKSDIMMPIQVGAKNSKIDLGIQRDDEGINMSEKNDRYCELTAQYWAWKNLDADYYGFMHYRRHFVFQDIAYPYDDEAPVSYPYIDQKYRDEIGLEDEAIYHSIGEYDLILPLPVDVASLGAVSNEVQFSCAECQHAMDFDLICKIVMELYPEYCDAIQEFRTGQCAYFCNIFIMKKEIFHDYSAWLFQILERSESKIDFTHYNQQETRVLAFMAERLLNIYLIKLLKDQPDLKIKHLKMTYVSNTDVGASENQGIKDLYDEDGSKVKYVYSAEKAYRELKALPLPYDLESLFPIKEHRMETLLYEKKLIFYGGGNWCEQLLCYFDRLGIHYPIEIWDMNAEEGQTIRGIRVIKPNFDAIPKEKDILWIITIYNRSVSNRIKRILSDYGVMNVVENRSLVNWLSYQLWLEVNL